MKNLIRIFLIVILIFLLSFTLKAQERIKLEKNRNIQAKNLIHKLNETKDTLILQSDQKINYLYSINKDYGRDFEINVDTTYFEFPLNKLAIGKHVLVAVQSPKRIVFVVKVFEEIPSPEPVKLVQNESVAIEPKGVVTTKSH
ncbi:hypothetical protein [Winogradskyella tangerina]|uniref:hypothetical protein n=1 Tax=Winogradskyella tangerina TaxID=2023240 RepID=UPI000DBE6FD0|nr:hypothetical protein [Winogradskyella tangerina]